MDRRHALGRLGGRLSLVFLQVFLERERLPAGAAGELTPCWVDGLGEFSKDFFEGGLRPRTVPDRPGHRPAMGLDRAGSRLLSRRVRDGDRRTPIGQRDVDVALVLVNDHPHQVRGGCRR